LPEQIGKGSTQIESSYKRLTYRPGEIIIHEGDVADRFYLITKGEVEVFQTKRGYRPVARLCSGQYFGEIGILRGRRRTATVRAAVDSETGVEVMAIDGDDFIKLVAESNMPLPEIVLIMRQRLAADEGATESE